MAIRHPRTLSGHEPRSLRVTSSSLPKSSTRRRALWGYFRERYEDEPNHAQRRADKYQRLCLSRMRGRTAFDPRRTQIFYHHEHHPWWNGGWGWNRFKSSFPGSRHGSHPKEDIWETESTRMQQRMEKIKKEIDADPYAALFGRRLEPFGFPGNFEKHVMSLCRSFFGTDKAQDPGAVNTTARPKTANSPSAHSPRSNKPVSEANEKASHTSQTPSMEDLKYDPISGRMVPRRSQPSGVSKQATSIDDTGPYDIPVRRFTPHNDRPGYLSAVGQSRESSSPIEGSDTANTKDQIRLDAPGVPHKDNTVGKEPAKDQRSGSLNTSVAASCDVAEKDNQEPSGESLRYQTDNDFQKSTAECYENDIKEQPQLPNLDKEVEVGRGDTKDLRPSDFIIRDNRTPTNFTILDTTQPHERLMSEEKAEDLDLLRASDIRSSYNSRNLGRGPEGQRKARKDMDDEFDAYVDPISDIDARSMRARFRHHAALKSDGLAGPESTTQLPSQGEESSISQLPSPETSTGSNKLSEQACTGPQPSADDSILSETYRVLAYDPSTLQVTQAETTSSLHTIHDALHPSEILPRLNNPAKFLPHFRAMRIDGYEIVSGGGDILVFRKTQPLRDRDTVYCAEEAQSDLSAGVRTEPLLSKEGIGRSQSAHRPVPGEDTPPSSAPGGNSHAQEINMSPQKSESKVGKVLRRMLIGGFATAATCYALGVVGEYFRTGGQDGRGIDGFTEFESERRQRDRK
ncbi:hypothetical protein BBP40_009044 [Aspergillus hancockii]|nr:hypothetical protein BBP40_009044 [Aspergillus hancockii]